MLKRLRKLKPKAWRTTIFLDVHDYEQKMILRRIYRYITEPNFIVELNNRFLCCFWNKLIQLFVTDIPFVISRILPPAPTMLAAAQGLRFSHWCHYDHFLFMSQIQAVLKKYDILFIADEVLC